jgi:pimeloyl-ACP methyl ester carboxylesterase
VKRIRSSAAACAVLGVTATAGLGSALAGEIPAHPVQAAVTATPSAGSARPIMDPTAAPVAPEADLRGVAWRACANPDFASAGIECGDLSVPLDYADPQGRRITVAVSRLEATAPAAERQGPLLVNFGGPGGTGVQAPLIFQALLPAEVLATYDVIGFDPRGLGDSRPALDCKNDPFKVQGHLPDFRPGTGLLEAPSADEDAWRARWRAFSAACAAEDGDLLPFVGSTSVVRDMDSIRAALGADRLNFWGFSYGTYLGQLYATTFPDRTRRFILDGNIDPATVWYEDLFVSARSFEQVSRRLWAWIAEHDDVYDLGSTATTVEAAYYREEGDLRKNPLERIGPTEWNLLLGSALYSQEAWPYVASVFAAQARGDSGPLKQAVLPPEGQSPEEAAADEQAAANGIAVFDAVFCSDGPWPRNYAQWRADGFANNAVAPFNTWAQIVGDLGCGSWPVRGERATVDGSVAPPLLLAGTTLDPATPFLNSLNVHLRFPNSALLADGGTVGHTATLLGNDCVSNVVFAYLRTGTLPDRQGGRAADVTCPGLPAPEPLAEDVARAQGDDDAAPDLNDLRVMLGVDETRRSGPHEASLTAKDPAARRAAARAALRAAIIASHHPGRL